MKAGEGAGDAIDTLQPVDKAVPAESRECICPLKFRDPPEIQAFTAESFVLLTNRVLILTSC